MRHPNQDWMATYRGRFSTPEQAIAAIEPGKRIFIGSGASVPNVLCEALVTHGGHLAHNPVVHLLTLGPAPYVEVQHQGRFRHTALFIGGNTREAVLDGRADFMPVFLSEIPRLISSRRMRIDVALVQVSPPDRHGYVSLGVSVDVVRAAVEHADLVIAQVNERMPRTLGDSVMHIERIAHLVPHEAALPELKPMELDEVAMGIGRNVASLIPDGATLQMGIGKIPDAVLACLGDRRDLGVHTEMFSDGVMELARRGVINGRRKTLLPGKIVTSFLMGTEELYEWAHDNPAVEMRPSEFTNDPFVIARNDRMIAINSALNVDLTGQVAADTLRGRFFSGIGGQVDFIRGAARARHGKPIIALPSTAKGGSISRILPVLEEGAGMVTSRGDVHYVVTEHGVADLWGRSIRERAMALIEIAHPDFRGELLAAAKARHYVFPDQEVPQPRQSWQAPQEAFCADRRRVLLRNMRAADIEAVINLVETIEEPAIRAAFLGGTAHGAGSVRSTLQSIDGARALCLVAIDRAYDGPAAYVGLARYDVDPATQMADFLVMSHPEWRNRQLGTVLLRRLHDIARAAGLSGLRAIFPADNQAALNLLYESALPFTGKLRDGQWRLKVRFGDRDEPKAAGQVRQGRVTGGVALRSLLPTPHDGDEFIANGRK